MIITRFERAYFYEPIARSIHYIVVLLHPRYQMQRMKQAHLKQNPEDQQSHAGPHRFIYLRSRNLPPAYRTRSETRPFGVDWTADPAATQEPNSS